METKFNFMKGVRMTAGTKCDVINLMHINDIIDYYRNAMPGTFTHFDAKLSVQQNENNKLNSPCVQVYATNKREDKTGIFNIWNGFVVVDIDSKCYNGKYKDELENMDDYLHDYFRELYPYNYFGMQKSFSGNSFHIYFGYNCDKTEINFNKAAKFSSNVVKDVFKQIGWEEVINCEGVLDNCTLNKSVQPIFLTDYYFYINYNFDGSLSWCKSLFDNITVDTTAAPESSIKIIKGKYSKTPKIAKQIVSSINDWRHDNRIKVIIILGKYFQANTGDARRLYEQFIDKVVMMPGIDNGNHGKHYYMTKFDEQYINLYKKNYSVNYRMMKFCEQNLDISFEYEVERKITENKFYTKKKVFLKSLEIK